MSNSQGHRYTIQSGDTIRFVLPPSISSHLLVAVDLFGEALRHRIDLDIEKVPQTSAQEANHSTTDIWFATPNTLPDYLADIEPPITIRPYPDYDEHINIRFTQQFNKLDILIITGSESSLIFGAGELLRHFNPYEGKIEFPLTYLDLQPLTPIRSILFGPNGLDSNASPGIDQWSDHLRELALLGNNTIGYSPALFHKEYDTRYESESEKRRFQEKLYRFSAYVHELGLNNLIWNDNQFNNGYPFHTFLRNIPYTNMIWCSSSSSASTNHPNDILKKARTLNELFNKEESEFEIWLGIDYLSEDEMDQFFQRLEKSPVPLCKALVCSSHSNSQEIIRREMPLTLQLIHAFTMSQHHTEQPPVPISTAFLAKQFAENAPLTYGVVGITSTLLEDIHRFVWSRITWYPQPPLEEIINTYARFHFGSEAAPYFYDAFFAIEKDWESFMELNEKAFTSFFSTVMEHVPEKMKERAKKRLNRFHFKENLP